MNQNTNKLLFSLIRSAICGTVIEKSEKKLYSEELLPELIDISKKHDIMHLLALGLKQNSLISNVDKSILEAVYRYEQNNYEYGVLCSALESAEIAFMPLKGSIMRKYYKEKWMRTSCDIDIFVHGNDLDKAISLLTDKFGYVYGKKGTHDVSLYAPSKVHVELHFDLIEDGRINNSTEVLKSVWEYSAVRDGYKYCYEMTDAMFYFYHIVHMAKHFEKGGCGIRPFIDLWILDKIETADIAERNNLLEKGCLSEFAQAVQRLSRIWFEGEEKDSLSEQVESYIFNGGVYGTVNNVFKIKAANGVGKTQSFLGLVFLSKEKLEEIYPNLKKYTILFPFYQVKRWFRIFKKDKRNRVKKLTNIRNSVSKEDINSTTALLDYLGL